MSSRRRGPLCFDCLTDAVTVSVIDDMGFEHWFCAADWAAHEAFRERLTEMFEEALATGHE